MMSAPDRAVPVVTELTKPFWDAAATGTLVVQRCGACGYFNHPPREACDRCLSRELGYEPVSGRGTVWSFSVMHQPSVAGFEGSVPYLTALVELDEQPMLLLATNLPGTAAEDLRIGQRVRATFEPIAGAPTLPQFVADDGDSG